MSNHEDNYRLFYFLSYSYSTENLSYMQIINDYFYMVFSILILDMVRPFPYSYVMEGKYEKLYFWLKAELSSTITKHPNKDVVGWLKMLDESIEHNLSKFE